MWCLVSPNIFRELVRVCIQLGLVVGVRVRVVYPDGRVYCEDGRDVEL